jgi:hypothetical protein
MFDPSGILIPPGSKIPPASEPFAAAFSINKSTDQAIKKHLKRVWKECVDKGSDNHQNEPLGAI